MSINKIQGSGDSGIEITSADGREFRLADLPVPANPGDRYDVEQQVLVLIRAVFPDEPIYFHIYSLDPPRYTLHLGPNTPADWWVQ